jgi:hypothetical protein
MLSQNGKQLPSALLPLKDEMAAAVTRSKPR